VFQSDDYLGHIIIIIVVVVVVIIIIILRSFKEMPWRMWLLRSCQMQVRYGTFLHIHVLVRP
jgi:hypothetical protein